MARHSQSSPREARDWHTRTLAAVTALVMAGSAATGTASPIPTTPIGRTRLALSKLLERARPAGKAQRSHLWLTLCSALPEIGTTPSSRADNPVLPTIGRPRDGPAVSALLGGTKALCMEGA